MSILNIFVMVPRENTEVWHAYEHNVWVGEWLHPADTYDILIAPMKRGLGYDRQPIEKCAKYCIFVGDNEHWIRMYENRNDNGRGQYVIHTEKFVSEKQINFERYVEGVFHSLASDPIDIRRAAKVGETFGVIPKG